MLGGRHGLLRSQRRRRPPSFRLEHAAGLATDAARTAENASAALDVLGKSISVAMAP
jgi:hypothetical protein